jgi:hypothetical protein
LRLLIDNRFNLMLPDDRGITQHEYQGMGKCNTISFCKQSRSNDEEERSVLQRYGWTPAALMSQLRSQNVSKPIDRVYGTLFLLPHQTRKQIAVDYSEESEFRKIYHRFACVLLESGQGADLLSYTQSCSRSQHLLSWCPNWNSVRRVEQPLNGGRRTDYGAGISSATPEGPLAQFSPDLSQFQVLGHRIDKSSPYILLLIGETRLSSPTTAWISQPCGFPQSQIVLSI